jgi:hypothetical protein
MPRLVLIPVPLLIERGVSRQMPIVSAIDKMKCTRWHGRRERQCGGPGGRGELCRPAGPWCVGDGHAWA